ncbi:ClpS-like protein [Fistulina hepatica ATCC 64428]|uniref:ClpS-like protein n=1 Tax=Fistulina hepatica ATCC 64428 TaxID=1128425 RepID=A0A0D7A4L6_9AGAR|nr:ClpS-like protein [Fistulina hepatica ATCC 64428]
MASRCSGYLQSLARTPALARTLPRRSCVRWASTEAAAPSKASPPPQYKNVDIPRIVTDISGLTLLQAADLVKALKEKLNIQEIAMPTTPTATAAATPAAAAEEEAAEEKPKEKTIFNVILESFDAASKPKVIRQVKGLVPNLTLIEAKKFVESLPKTLKEGLPKEEAEELKKTFEALGGVVKLD